MFHCANCWFERWRGRSLSDSSEEVHYGSARSTAGDGGNSDTRTTLRLYHSITREHIDHVSGS